MDAAQRIAVIHKLKILDELFNRINPDDFVVQQQQQQHNNEYEIYNAASGVADYMTNPNCDAVDAYSWKLSELLNVIGEQILSSLVELRKGYETAATSGDEGKLTID